MIQTGRGQSAPPRFVSLERFDLSSHERQRDAIAEEIVDATLLHEPGCAEELARTWKCIDIVRQLREHEPRARGGELRDHGVCERPTHARAAHARLDDHEVQPSGATRATKESEHGHAVDLFTRHARHRAAIRARRAYRRPQGIEGAIEIVGVVERALDRCQRARQQRWRERDNVSLLAQPRRRQM